MVTFCETRNPRPHCGRGFAQISYTVYRAMPIEALFDGARAESPAPRAPEDHASGPDVGAARSATPRTMARWSDVTADRMQALDELASTASEAIRTLRGLTGDDDPTVAREATRLLRELDVRC